MENAVFFQTTRNDGRFLGPGYYDVPGGFSSGEGNHVHRQAVSTNQGFELRLVPFLPLKSGSLTQRDSVLEPVRGASCRLLRAIDQMPSDDASSSNIDLRHSCASLPHQPPTFVV